jgi:hypothetical protein
MEVRDAVGTCLPAIAARLESVAADIDGGTSVLREVRHLEPCVVTVLQHRLPEHVVRKNRRVEIPSWSPVGNVDVVAYRLTETAADLAVELKWCHVDKLYEAIWDLFKMALLSTSGVDTYLVTGARAATWATGVGRELFDNATHSPAELCEVRLPWGQKLRAWDDLLWGGHDKFPSEVPSQIQTAMVGRESVFGDWELRAVKVVAMDERMTAFDHGWPFPRPTDAVRPLRAA